MLTIFFCTYDNCLNNTFVLRINIQFTFCSYRNFCAAAVSQLNTDPANLILNVDVRNLSGGAGSSLAEATADEDEEQNCLSGKIAEGNINEKIL